MPTAADLIRSAALKLGAISSGESLTASEASDGLNVLNSMLDFWAINRLFIYQIVQSSYSWTGGQASRTIGSGGNFNATRPVRIEDGSYFRDSNSIDSPVSIIRDRATYDQLASKSDQTTFPEFLYYEPSYPLGTLYAYPVPSQTITLKLNSWQTLQSFAALTDNLSLPPGYQWTIEHNLAVALEPIFDLSCPAAVKAEAIKSKSAIASINSVPLTAMTEAAFVISGRGRSDIEAGV
jgi:hypothetical protein